MSKRRKIWWFGGGVVVLYSALAFFVSWNSPDARLERTLDEIIAENGFELDNIPGYEIGVPIDWEMTTRYQGKPISQKNERRTLTKFRESCPEFKMEHVTVSGAFHHSTSPEINSYSAYILNAPDGSKYDTIIITFDDRDLSYVGSPVSVLTVIQLRDEDRWSFLRNIWPW